MTQFLGTLAAGPPCCSDISHNIDTSCPAYIDFLIAIIFYQLRAKFKQFAKHSAYYVYSTSYTCDAVKPRSFRFRINVTDQVGYSTPLKKQEFLVSSKTFHSVISRCELPLVSATSPPDTSQVFEIPAHQGRKAPGHGSRQAPRRRPFPPTFDNLPGQSYGYSTSAVYSTVEAAFALEPATKREPVQAGKCPAGSGRRHERDWL